MIKIVIAAVMVTVASFIVFTEIDKKKESPLWLWLLKLISFLGVEFAGFALIYYLQ